MGDNTGISWTDATWNPIRGCSRTIAAGAKQSGCGDGTGGGCYAERTAGRFCGSGQPYEGLVRITAKGPRWTGVVRMVPEYLADPLRWRRPRRIFVASMSDPFHDELSDEDIDYIFAMMALADHHVYQLLTKRAHRMRSYASDPNRPFRVLRAIDRLEVDLAMEEVSEEWREIPSCPIYDVSNFGNVRRGGRLLSLVECGPSRGYRQVALCVDGRPRTTLVHRIVLEAFDRPAREGEEGAHRNGDRGDNRLANLRWATKDENMQDAARQGTAGVWMKSRATLTPDEVTDIRAARARGEKLESVATRFGIAKQQVSAIATGKIFKPAQLAWPIPQLWLGVSVENQAAADERIPELLATPAAVRFLSCEPLLGPIDLFAFLKGDLRDRSLRALGADGPLPGVSWVICGAESGPGARPADLAWFRSLRDQCAAAGVPFFLKQGVTTGAEFVAGPGDGHRGLYAGTGSKRKACGVIELPYLDGVQHVAFPEPTR